GKMFIGDALAGNIDVINYLLLNSMWCTGITLIDSTLDIIVAIDHFIEFPPFTNEINRLFLAEPNVIICGENAYPFAFLNDSNLIPIAAISYPFLQENNCSSFVIFATGIHCWERDYFGANIDDFYFAANIYRGLTTSYLEPGAIPGGGNACDEIPDEYHCTRVPNPFTPNSDGINDHCQFLFEGMGYKSAQIYIYDVHSVLVRQINVPTGADAKRSARWDGLDNNGKPLPQGLYIYVIEVDGEIVCKGTVTIAR
ncbi:hypothetical protein DRQ33_08750, partial [bacterium]